MTTAPPTTRSEGRVTRTVLLDASPAAVFAALADPREHAALDGSGLVRGLADGPDRLALGDVVVMRMAG